MRPRTSTLLAAGALTATVGTVLGVSPASASSPISDKYAALGGSRGFLGAPTTPVYTTPNGVGQFEHFRGGSIYWSPATGAHEVHGAIRDAWAAKGWETSLLGFPTSDEIRLTGGAVSLFSGGSIYWSPTTGAHEVHGAVRDLWATKGLERSFLGYPTSDVNPIAGGAFSTFTGGSVYSSRAGTHEVHGAIRDAWGALGWEGGRVGWPTSDETPTPDLPGAFNHFERGSIYWSPRTPASEIEGAIRDRWASLGWENSSVGFPVTNESDVPNVPGGRGNTFQYGRIEWTAATGTVVVGAADKVTAIDHTAHTFTIGAVDETYTYTAADHFFTINDFNVDPTPIDFDAFDQGLQTGHYAIADTSLDPSYGSYFYLVPAATPAAARAAAKAVLAR